MKRVIVIIVFGLMWCNVGFAECIEGDCDNGYGTYTYASGEFAGDKYVGERKDGEMHGQGTYTRANGEIIKGIFKDGKLFKSSTKQPSTSTSASKNKLADELKELKKLYKDGTLTKAEFSKAKSKLLK